MIDTNLFLPNQIFSDRIKLKLSAWIRDRNISSKVHNLPFVKHTTSMSFGCIFASSRAFFNTPKTCARWCLAVSRGRNPETSEVKILIYIHSFYEFCLKWLRKFFAGFLSFFSVKNLKRFSPSFIQNLPKNNF